MLSYSIDSGTRAGVHRGSEHTAVRKLSKNHAGWLNVRARKVNKYEYIDYTYILTAARNTMKRFCLVFAAHDPT